MVKNKILTSLINQKKMYAASIQTKNVPLNVDKITPSLTQ